MDFEKIFELDFNKSTATDSSLILIIYDIVDDKKRSKISKLLKGYGYRIQRSVFECNLTKVRYLNMISKLSKLVNEDTDLVKVYKLNKMVEIKSWGNEEIKDDDFYIL